MVLNNNMNITQEETTEIEEVTEKKVIPITVQSLLEAGAHFGHKTSNWNPSMAPYIYGSRNDVYIFNLERTLTLWQKAREQIVKVAEKGGTVLMAGAKKQCKEVLSREAVRCNSPYISHKWVAGILTNFNTVRVSIRKMKNLREFLERCEEGGVTITKKEKLFKKRELEKLEKQFGGIENMNKRPDLIFIADINKHHIAIDEARNMHIPTVALVDSNANPDLVDYIIPANDDSNGSLELFITNVSDAILEGQELREQNLRSQKDVMTDEEMKAEEAAIQEKIDVDFKQYSKAKNKRTVRRKTREKKDKPSYPDKKQISSGITFYTEEKHNKETS